MIDTNQLISITLSLIDASRAIDAGRSFLQMKKAENKYRYEKAYTDLIYSIENYFGLLKDGNLIPAPPITLGLVKS